MNRLWLRLWNDDDGALIATEFLFLGTVLVVGIAAGLSNMRDAVVTEMTEMGNATLALSQGYIIGGGIGCCSMTDGSNAIDTPGVLVPPTCTPPAIPSTIDVRNTVDVKCAQ